MRAVILAICGLCTLGGPVAAASQSTPEAGQQKTLQAFEAAWEKGDIEAMLGLCTADMEYINASGGFYWRTQAELRRGWAFERSFGALPKLAARSFRQLDSQTAIAVSRYVIEMPEAQQRAGAPKSVEGITTTVFHLKGGRWLISHGQSTMVNPQAPAPK